ncbi:hypothetical protein ACJJTC_016022 [Scirpophaga incertulas]
MLRHCAVCSPIIPFRLVVGSCSYDFLEIIEPQPENTTEHVLEDWLPEDAYSAENEVWDEPELLLAESDAASAGWSREGGALHARRLCGDWAGKLKLLRYQSTADTLRLRFRSDHSRHYAGFKAKITLTDFAATIFWRLLSHNRRTQPNTCSKTGSLKDAYSAENEVWDEPELLLAESDAASAGWSREGGAMHARRLCGDWAGKLKLLRYQSTLIRCACASAPTTLATTQASRPKLRLLTSSNYWNKLPEKSINALAYVSTNEGYIFRNFNRKLGNPL